MGSGSGRTFTGAVNSTGSLITVNCGFRPRKVDLYLENGDEGHWAEPMAEGSAFKRVTAGTGSTVTTNGVTPTNTGFTLGTDADLNPGTAEVIYWRCED